jgi:predicted ATPase/DNA-binding SARP family transcriptional activator
MAASPPLSSRRTPRPARGRVRNRGSRFKREKIWPDLPDSQPSGVPCHRGASGYARRVTGGRWRIAVLGPLLLERDGMWVRLPAGHVRSLLALLAMRGGAPLSRDGLIDELWGESTPVSAASALHVHLSKLRRAIGDLLVSDASGYSLDADAYELDAERLDALIGQARAAPDGARSLLGEALGLFRGEPLCDVAAEGSLAQWRLRLEDRRFQATLLRVDADLAAGAASELVPELDQLTAEHPHEDRVWGQLMLALYRSGRQIDALDAYQRARSVAIELGLQPGEALSTLQQQILEHHPGLVPAGPAPSAAATDAPAGPATAAAATDASAALADLPRSPAFNLPRSPTRLIGRDRDLESLVGLMDDPDTRIMTLTGAGGVGKTRLALELARRQEPTYSYGAAFVRLEGVTDPSLVSAEIATVLARRDGNDALSADALLRYLRDRELLLLIDNFEHLMAGAPLVAELVAELSAVRVLVTSRMPLRIRGELVYEVEPLELPVGDGPDELASSPAVQLFVQSALAANRKLEMDAVTTVATASICRALGGLPLGIELAASRARSLTASEIAEQLTEPLSIGGYALRDLPDRQQTLHATIRWSFDLLSAAAQTVLCSASVFLGGFTRPALEAVKGAPVPTELDELLEANLIRRQAGSDRFELVELVRVFALRELERTGSVDVARSRHRQYFRSWSKPAAAAWDVGSTTVGIPMLPDHANMRAALEDAITAGDQGSAVELALGMRGIWHAGQLRQESQELVEQLLARFEILDGADVRLMIAVGVLDYSPRGSAWYRRAAKRAAEIGDSEQLARITTNMFSRAVNARDQAELDRLRPQLRGLISRGITPKAVGWIHYQLAIEACADGRYDESCEHADRSIERAVGAGVDYMLAAAVTTRLLSQSARDGTISHAALAEALELARKPVVPLLSVVNLWLVARYAAAVDREAAVWWLVHAERVFATLDAELWPETMLRDEAMAELGLDDLEPLMADVPPLDHIAALDVAAAWLAGRDPAEVAPRAVSTAGAEPHPRPIAAAGQRTERATRSPAGPPRAA